jgi:hypothetical protein
MSRIEKVLGKWENTGQPVPKEQVIAVLEKYFPDKYEFKGGSHIVVKDPRLRGFPGFAEGWFTIAVTGGQKVKPIYLRRLVKIIEFLMEPYGNK